MPAASEQTEVSMPSPMPSPYRYPVKGSRALVLTARIAGMSFVLIGAFFSAFYTHYMVTGTTLAALFTSVPQTASVCNPQSSAFEPDNIECVVPGSDLAVTDPGSSCLVTDQECIENFYGSIGAGEGDASQQMNIERDVNVSIDSDEPLTGEVAVSINAIEATKVSVIVANRSGEQFKLGFADYISEDLWVIDWKTNDYPDGDYIIRSFVSYDYSSHYSDSRYFRVENNPVEELPGVSKETDDTSEQPVITEIRSDYIGSNDDRLRLNVSVTDAETVTVRLRNDATNELQILGNAFEWDSDRWRFSFNIDNYQAGEYTLQVQAVNDNGEFTDTLSVEFSGQAETQNTDENTESNEDEVLLSEEEMDPEIQVQILSTSPVSGLATVRVTAEDVSVVELYVEARFASTPRYLNLAQQIDANTWEYVWDTIDVPNGEYRVSATAKNNFGVFASEAVPVLVYNKPELLTDVGKSFVELQEVYETDESATYIPQTATRTSPVRDVNINPDVDIAEETTGATEQLEDEVSEPDELVSTDVDNSPEEQPSIDVHQTKATDAITNYRDELNDEHNRLAAAYRMKDSVAIAETDSRINTIRAKILTEEVDEAEREMVAQKIDEFLVMTNERIEADVKRVENLVERRTGNNVAMDSDNDGVSDFDEINIFNTDPNVADSDGDGFIDGAEILRGFDPRDAVAEALVQYESPKDVGIVREDLLQVNSITAAEPLETDSDGVRSEAVISGVGLPNSYVTIYIFSTPVIITVKTDADGSWTYRFDKELEDGTHEVYVGVTDNTGQIIAKSEPFAFVKEAEAFTPADASVTAIVSTNEPESFIDSSYMVYLVLSISIVAIGLVLIIVGLHVEVRREDEVVVPNAKPAT